MIVNMQIGAGRAPQRDASSCAATGSNPSIQAKAAKAITEATTNIMPFASNKSAVISLSILACFPCGLDANSPFRPGEGLLL